MSRTVLSMGALGGLACVCFVATDVVAAEPSAEARTSVVELELDLDLAASQGRLGDHRFEIPHARVALSQEGGTFVARPTMDAAWSPKRWRLFARAFDAAGKSLGEDHASGTGLPVIELASDKLGASPARVEADFFVETSAEKLIASRASIEQQRPVLSRTRAARVWLEIDGQKAEVPVVDRHGRVSLDLDAPAMVQITIDFEDGARTELTRVVKTGGSVQRPDARLPQKIAFEGSRRLSIGRARRDLPKSDPIARNAELTFTGAQARVRLVAARPQGTLGFVVRLEDEQGHLLSRARGHGEGESRVELSCAAALVRAGAWLYIEADHDGGARMLGPRLYLAPWSPGASGTWGAIDEANLGARIEERRKNAKSKDGAPVVVWIASGNAEKLKAVERMFAEANDSAVRLVTELDLSLDAEVRWSTWVMAAPRVVAETLAADVRPWREAEARGESGRAFDASGRIIRVGRSPGPELIVPLPESYSADRAP